MNRTLAWAMTLGLLTGTVYAQVPSGNDVSDANDNTGMGTGALGGPAASKSGQYNTSAGAKTLEKNTTGNENTAVGYYALEGNTTGCCNTATGSNALDNNVSGQENTAIGYATLLDSNGNFNTAAGSFALASNTTGSFNIAYGYQAGRNLTTGANNIDIGNEGEATDGVAANHGVIRIGNVSTQTKTFIAGIENSKITGKAVYVTASGELGVLASSERYKTAIEPMGTQTEKLSQLRPVSFHLKSDPQGDVQYVLIAEEVAKAYPELVTRDLNGRIDGLRYEELAPMLLNEIQKEQATVAAQAASIASLEEKHDADAIRIEQQAAKVASLEQKVAQVDDLERQLSAVVQELKARNGLVAQR